MPHERSERNLILKEKQVRNVGAIKTSIGGQALMEGIMMRGPKKAAMAVRNPEGKMVMEEIELKSAKRAKFCRLPIIRGVFGFIDSMTLGYRCLMRSAEISALEDLVEESPNSSKKQETSEKHSELEQDIGTTVGGSSVPNGPCELQTSETERDTQKIDSAKDQKIPAWAMNLMMVGTVLVAVVLAVGLFLWLPSFLFELLSGHVSWLRPQNAALASLIKSAFEGLFKVILLVGYMAAVSLMKEIRRTFMYHGAEHKTIFCYEAGLDLTVENVRKQGRFHPRCGTSFLILMVIVSIFISFFIDPITIAISGHTLPSVWRALLKLALLPITMGIGYELIKWAGRKENLLTRVISAPGMWLQHITVFEPTDDMIECAIAAIRAVIPEDGSDRVE